MKRYLIAGCGVILLLAVYAVVDLVRVPDAAGTYQAATNRLYDAGLQVAAVDAAGRPREPHDLELVTDQSPGAGSIRRIGSVVTLRTRVPKSEVVVPDVVGRRVSEAAVLVHDAGLSLFSASGPDDGIVATTTPAPGAVVHFGSTVLYVLVPKG